MARPFTKAADYNAPHSGLPLLWLPSIALYGAFALAVFLVQGSHPLLGPDHVSYMQHADEILEKRPAGDFWKETNSVRSYGVLLAYLHGWTGSHVQSMKILLAALTVAYLLSAELLFGLFAKARWQAMLFAILSAFAVSFGFASWGVTDSTALLARTTVAPIVILSFWYWFRYRDHLRKYLVFPFLICGSLLHLSTFHVMGVFGLLELWDIAANRKFKFDSRIPAFLGSLVIAAGLLFVFESLNISVEVFRGVIPRMFAAKKVEAPKTIAKAGSPFDSRTESGAERGPSGGADGSTSAGATETVTASARQAWQLELSLRPWRNMPLPLVNFANLLSSYLVILALAFAGLTLAKREGLTSSDRDMIALFVAVPVFSFFPQTALWILRSFADVYPATIEEVRAISLVMIPSLYFVMRLFRSIVESDRTFRTAKAATVVVGVVALPLAMKSMPYTFREMILSTMTAIGVVDATMPSSVNNARSVLGISHELPFYYSTERAIQWFRENTVPGVRILTDRDEFVLLRGWEVVGPRQVAAVPARNGVELPEMTEVFFRTKDALASREMSAVRQLAREYGAEFVVVPWRVEKARYVDDCFSIVYLEREENE